MTTVPLSHAEWLTRQHEKMRAKRLARIVPGTMTLSEVIADTEHSIRSAIHDDRFVPSDSRQSQRLVERLLAAGETPTYDGLTDEARCFVNNLISRGWVSESSFRAALAFARAEFDDWQNQGRDPRWLR